MNKPGLPVVAHSIKTQVVSATAADISVATAAYAACEFALKAEPALNPNQPATAM